jgi:hypothetical protein
MPDPFVVRASGKVHSRLRGDAGTETGRQRVATDYSDISWNGWLERMAQTRCRKVVDTASRPFPLNSRIQALVAHPTGSALLGGEVYVTENAGASWRKIAREFGEIRTHFGYPTNFY